MAGCPDIPKLPKLADPNQVDDGAVVGGVRGETLDNCLPELDLLVRVPCTNWNWLIIAASYTSSSTFILSNIFKNVLLRSRDFKIT